MSIAQRRDCAGETTQVIVSLYDARPQELLSAGARLYLPMTHGGDVTLLEKAAYLECWRLKPDRARPYLAPIFAGRDLDRHALVKGPTDYLFIRYCNFRRCVANKDLLHWMQHMHRYPLGDIAAFECLILE